MFATAEIVAAEPSQQFLVAMNKAMTAFDASFGGEAFAAFTGGLESTPFACCAFSRDTSNVIWSRHGAAHNT